MIELKNNLPTLENLKGVFSFLMQSYYQSTPGVFVYDSGVTGPQLGITMCTHGNEPAGLAILWYFKENNLWHLIKKGKIFFILQNIRATSRYFDDLHSESRNKHRFTDINYNRLPENSHEIKNPESYEVQRLQQLYPIYQQFTHGFDIHTSEDEAPMIIAGSKFYPELVKGFPIETVLTNISNPQSGYPSFEFFGGLENEIPVFEIEAGTNEGIKSFETSIICAVSLLKNLDFIEGDTKAAVPHYKEYFIYDSVLFPNKSFKLTKFFSYYEKIEKNQILANGIVDGKEVEFKCKEDGHVIFPPINKLKRNHFLTDEQMFISRSVKILNT